MDLAPKTRPTRSAATTRECSCHDVSITRQLNELISTLSNPTVSNEAKETAKQELKNLGAGDFDYESKIPDEQNNNPGNVAGGLKA